MRLTALAFGLVLVVSGCVSTAYDPGHGAGGSAGSGGGGSAGSGGGGSAGSGGGGSGGGGGGGATGGGVSGTLAADTTWSGLTEVSGDVTVPTGVTLTVAAGARVQFAAGKALLVNGTLKVQGTAASTVSLAPMQMPGSWAGIQVNQGGSATIAYADLAFPATGLTCAAGAAACAADHTKVHDYQSTGMSIQAAATLSHVDIENGGSGGLYMNGAATDTITVTDSTFHLTGGDAVICDGGNLTFQYNKSFGNGGATPGQHCACHFNSMGTMLVDHNDFSDSTYGFMASGMSGTSKVNNNNFAADANAYGPASGGISATADLSQNYWGGPTAPMIMGNTTNQKNAQGLPANAFYTTAVTGTGPRP